MNKALELAKEALSNDEFPVGCVIVHDNKIVAKGSRCNSGVKVNEVDHAEMVALRNLLSTPSKVDLSEVVVYSTMEPCLMCFATLLVNGVTRFVYGYEDAMGGGTSLPLEKLAPLYRDIKLEITPGVLRSNCLELFKQFFSVSGNPYLRDSYLAEYTLKQ